MRDFCDFSKGAGVRYRLFPTRFCEAPEIFVIEFRR